MPQYSEKLWGLKKQPSEVLCKKGILKNFAIFTGKQLCWSLFLIKLQALRPATLLNKRLPHSCLLANFAKFLRTPFYRTPLVTASVNI